jgi:hypothetical protein
MTKLCPRGKAAAKRKFKVYPSAYANAYASKICAGKIKDPSGVKRKDFRGPKPVMKGGMMKYAKGDQVKVNKVSRALKKASKLHAAQAKTLSTVKAKNGRHMDNDPANKPGPGKDFPKRKRGEISINKMPIIQRPIKKDLPKVKEGAYIGSYIKSEIDGKKISNKSYEKYYKGMI